jgi:hypothetical protein
MTVSLGYVDTEPGHIEQHFAVQKITLTNNILRGLRSRGLDVNDCCSQGFDNETKVVGVKTKTSANNPRAFCIASGYHGWGLLLGDVGKPSRMAVSFFLFNPKYVHFFPAFGSGE